MSFYKTCIPLILVWAIALPLNAATTLTYGPESKVITGVKITLTESDGTITILSTDTNGQVTLPTTSNTYTLSASLAETGTDPVDLLDAIYILQHSGELRTLTADQLKAADVSEDGEVDLLDAIYILQHSGELRTLSPNLIFLDTNTGNALSETTFSPGNTPSITVIRTGDVDQSFDPTLITDHAPILTGKTTLSIDEEKTVVSTLVGTDADTDTLTYEITGGVDKDLFTINASTGALSFIAGTDYEDPSDSGGDNLYDVEITVSDGVNTTAQALTINVINVNETPVISGLSSSITVAENQTAVVTVSASDPESGTLTYTLSGTDASSFSISSSGVITFISNPDYETKTSYSVTVTVSDGTNTITQALTISISDIAETYDVSGTAYASRYFVLDSDVPNTTDQGFTSNEFGSQQSLYNPTVVVGHTGTVTVDSVTTTDDYDLYSVQLTANMYVNLDVSDFEAGVKDLDMYLYNADGTTYNFTYATGFTEDNETINLPTSGTKLIQVKPMAGASKYVLTLGQRITGSSVSNYKNKQDHFISGEFVSYIPFKGKTAVNNQSAGSRFRIREERTADPLRERLQSINSPGLRKHKFDLDLELQRNQIEPTQIQSKDNNLQLSEEQINYLKHWKIKKQLEAEYPDRNIEFNYKVEPFATFTKDPYFKYQWHMNAIGLESGLNAVGQETKDIVVAVIDSGSPVTTSTAWTTSNFIAGGVDFIDNDFNPTDDLASSTGPLARNTLSHGTHVGTTIGAKNDGNNINGFGVKVLPLKACSDDSCTFYNIANAMLYAAGLPNESGSIAPTSEGPVKVINMSLGGPTGGWSCYWSAIINDVIDQGVTIVAAAGNSALKTPGGSNYPAACDNVISVGATDTTGLRAPYSDYNNSVDIAAPGGNTGLDENGDGFPDGVLAYIRNEVPFPIQGTSMAAPHVSGSLAVLHSIDSGLTPAETETYLQGGYLTDDIGSSGRDDEYGFGTLNLAKAVQSVIENEAITASYAIPSPLILNYGFDTNVLDITLTKVGSASLSVSSVNAEVVTGLSYSSSVDSEGFGTYTIHLDKTSLPDGNFQNTIYFNMSDGTAPAVRINYSKGSERARADLGKVWVVLYDVGDDGVDVDDEIIANGSLDFDGSLSFVASDIDTGDYYFYVSTDIDNNGWICEAGEACASFPFFGASETYFSLTKEDIEGDAIYLSAIINNRSFSASSSVLSKEPRQLSLNIEETSVPDINLIEDNSETPLSLAKENQFIKSDFLLSMEYKNYTASNILHPQVLVRLVVNKTGQKIIANNPVEAEAIKQYIKRVFNFDTATQTIGILK